MEFSDLLRRRRMVHHFESRPLPSDVHINVRVPIMLLRAGVRLASLIPPKAQEKVNEELRKNGMDFDVSQIKPENINELIDQLQDLSIDIDHEHDDVKVRIFCE